MLRRRFIQLLTAVPFVGSFLALRHNKPAIAAELNALSGVFNLRVVLYRSGAVAGWLNGRPMLVDLWAEAKNVMTPSGIELVIKHGYCLFIDTTDWFAHAQIVVDKSQGTIHLDNFTHYPKIQAKHFV